MAITMENIIPLIEKALKKAIHDEVSCRLCHESLTIYYT